MRPDGVNMMGMRRDSDIAPAAAPDAPGAEKWCITSNGYEYRATVPTGGSHRVVCFPDGPVAFFINAPDGQVIASFYGVTACYLHATAERRNP